MLSECKRFDVSLKSGVCMQCGVPGEKTIHVSRAYKCKLETLPVCFSCMADACMGVLIDRPQLFNAVLNAVQEAATAPQETIPTEAPTEEENAA